MCIIFDIDICINYDTVGVSFLIKGYFMNDFDTDLLDSVIRADLTKTELNAVVMMLKSNEKTITATNSDMAEKLGIARPNYQRLIKSLIQKNVLGKRTNGIFVKSKNSWGRKKG